MSRRNKVNPDHYTIAGRLSPDDLAREQRKQSERLFGATRGKKQKPMPPWMADDMPDDASDGESADAAGDLAGAAQMVDSEDAVSLAAEDATKATQTPQAEARATSRKRKVTRTGTRRGARSAGAKTRSTSKMSGGRATPKRATSRAAGAATKSAKKAKKSAPAKKAKTSTRAKTATTAKKARKAKKR